jgi:hypothetical protein
MKQIKYGLVAVTLTTSIVVNAKSWTDALIDKVVDKVAEAIHIGKSPIQASASNDTSKTSRTEATTSQYNYSDYPITNIYTGKPAKLNLASNKNARSFKTRLNEGLQDGVNFAGSYSIVTWGCGTECMAGAMVNVQTGQVIDLPEVGFEQGIQKDSALYVVNPNPDEPAINPATGEADIDYETGKPYPRYPSYAETNYYQWNGNSFIKLNP